MGMEIQQLDDNSVVFINDADSKHDMRVGGPATATVASPRRMAVSVAKMPLAAADTGGGVLSWQNNLGFDIIVVRLIIDVTTIATGAGTVSAGMATASATTSSANLIDTLDVHSATGTFDNITDASTNGKARQKVASLKWITISKASGACAGLAGYAYIHYHPV